MEGKGSTVRFPGRTHSKRSRSCRQGLEALQKMDVNRNILPKILRVHLGSNSISGFCCISRHHTKRTKQTSEQSKWLEGKETTGS